MNIKKALAAGYSASQILGILTSAYPYLTQRIKHAQSVGHSLEEIFSQFEGASEKDLKFLNEKAKRSSNPLISGQAFSREDTGKTFREKTIPTIALTGASLAAAPLLAQGASGAIKGFLKPGTSQSIPGSSPPSPIGPGPIGPQPMANAPVSPPPMQATAPPNVAQAAGAVPQAPVQPVIDSSKILQEMGLESRIENLLKAGNDPLTIAKVLEHQLTPGQKKWLGEGIKAGQAKSMQEMVAEYVAKRKQAPQPAPSAPATPSPEKLAPEADRIDQMAKEWEEIEKGYKEPESKYGFDFWEEFVSKDTKNPPKSTKDKIRKVNYELDRLEKLYERADKHNNESLKMDAVQQHQDLERYLKHLQDKDIEEMAAKPKKGSVVATPDGIIGSVKDIKEKEALIESDGKLSKAKSEDLVSIPKEDQDFDFRKLAEIYKSKFPKEGAGSLSDNLASVFHGPENNTLFVSFVTSPGKGYIYRNVPKELYEKVLSQSVAPKTKGTGIFGGWNPDVVDSRGAAFQEIKADPEKYPFEVVEMGYNMLEPLIQAIAEMQKEEQKKNAQAKKQAKRKPS